MKEFKHTFKSGLDVKLVQDGDYIFSTIGNNNSKENSVIRLSDISIASVAVEEAELDKSDDKTPFDPDKISEMKFDYSRKSVDKKFVVILRVVVKGCNNIINVVLDEYDPKDCGYINELMKFIKDCTYYTHIVHTREMKSVSVY